MELALSIVGIWTACSFALVLAISVVLRHDRGGGPRRASVAPHKSVRSRV